MANAHNRRLPISCEPCRVRKIRCPRDSTPCGTCLRRGIAASQCVYAKRLSMPPSSLFYSRPSGPISPVSTEKSSTSSNNADLAERVRKLEQMLQSQITSQPLIESLATPKSNSAKTPDTDHRRGDAHAKPRPYQLRGSLRTSESGHVRFVPDGSQWSSVLGPTLNTSLEFDNAVADTSNGPFPFGQSDRHSLQELLARLPPVRLCRELKDVYFDSFSPVCTSCGSSLC